MGGKKKSTLPRVFLTSDLHFQHKAILRHCPGRAKVGGFDVDDVEAHDKWLVSRWNERIGKKDIVYILGDFSFGSPESVGKLLGKLNGKKFLVLGNHDKSSEHLTGYFEQITQLKEVTFKKCNYDFLDEDFMVFMSHYPMVTWPSKHYGCVQLHGHCHSRLDDYNEESLDLRMDVGFDCKYDFYTLEEVYRIFKDKAKGEAFRDYAFAKKNGRKEHKSVELRETDNWLKILYIHVKYFFKRRKRKMIV